MLPIQTQSEAFLCFAALSATDKIFMLSCLYEDAGQGLQLLAPIYSSGSTTSPRILTT
jgi:hypothetical protein